MGLDATVQVVSSKSMNYEFDLALLLDSVHHDQSI